jgi:hypothetical protein
MRMRELLWRFQTQYSWGGSGSSVAVQRRKSKRKASTCFNLEDYGARLFLLITLWDSHRANDATSKKPPPTKRLTGKPYSSTILMQCSQIHGSYSPIRV